MPVSIDQIVQITTPYMQYAFEHLPIDDARLLAIYFLCDFNVVM